jgi:MarR family transcriptional regulator, lower aerobic nicotinate degradation pathway regulator
VNPKRRPTSEAVKLGFLSGLVSYRVRLLQIAAYKDFEENLRKFGVAPRYFGLLTLIEENPGSSQARLADAIHLLRSSLVPILDKLEAERLVERRSVREDRRSKAIWLTATGQAVLAKLRPHVVAHEKRLVAGFSGTQRRVILELIELADENLRRAAKEANAA